MSSGPGGLKVQTAPQQRSWLSANVRAVLILAILGALFVSFRKPLADYAWCWDFNEFYIAGQMIRHGDTARFYDFSAQAEYQAKYVGAPEIPGVPDLPFLYPAATAIPYLPLAWLPLKAAYAIWMVVNLALLLVSVRLMQQEFAIPQGDWPLLASLVAAPVFIGLVGGQIIFLLLLLYVLAFRAMRRQQFFLAGILIGLVGLKFQLMLGVAVILLLRGFWKAVAGIAVGGVVVALLSAIVIGWRLVLAYPAFVRAATYHRHVAYAPAMTNLRGLYALLTGNEPRVWLMALLSVCILGAAAWAWKDLETGFALAIIATLLTAFHEYPQEMSLLLIPLAIAAQRVRWDRKSTAALFVLVPAVTFALFSIRAQGLMGISCAALLVGMLIVNRQSSGEQVTAAIAESRV